METITWHVRDLELIKLLNNICENEWYDFLAGDTITPGRDLRELAESKPERLPKELHDLIGVIQSAEHHPEGDAFIHTTHTVQAMSEICIRENIYETQRVELMLSMICHDMGKRVSTRFDEKKQKWSSSGHDVTGVPLARIFLERINCSIGSTNKILALVRWHMLHSRPSNNHTKKAVAKLIEKLRPASVYELLLVMESDCGGRPPLSPDLPSCVVPFIEKCFTFGVLSSRETTKLRIEGNVNVHEPKS